MIIRSRTFDLFESDNLTDNQIKNSKLNKFEICNEVTKLESYPQRIVLELTNACNLNCIMCGRNFAEFKPTIFNMEWLYRFEDILNHIEEVTLIGWGEPTMHPEFIQILEYLNKFNVRKFVCSNGMKILDIKDHIFDFKLDLLTISLDASKAELNEAIRQGSDFNKIIDGMKYLVKEKKKRNLSYPYLGTTTTIMKDNIEDLPNVIKMVGEIGFNEAKVVYLTSFSKEMSDKTLYNHQELVKEIFDRCVEIAKKYNINLKLPHLQGEDEAGDKCHKDCYVAWRDLFLSSDGYIRPCMSTPIKLLKIDNYNNFFDFWNSQEFVNFRKIVNSKEMPVTCKKCYQASYANWNKKYAFNQLDGNFSPEWEK